MGGGAFNKASFAFRTSASAAIAAAYSSTCLTYWAKPW